MNKVLKGLDYSIKTEMYFLKLIGPETKSKITLSPRFCSPVESYSVRARYLYSFPDRILRIPDKRQKFL